MKKTLALLLTLAIAGTMTFVSCSGNGSAAKNSPEATVEKAMKLIINEDYDGVFNMFDKAGQASDEEKAFIVALLQEANKQNGGLDSYEVVNVEYSDDNTTAKVTGKYTYKDGTEKEQSDKVVKTDDGWMLTFF